VKRDFAFLIILFVFGIASCFPPPAWSGGSHQSYPATTDVDADLALKADSSTVSAHTVAATGVHGAGANTRFLTASETVTASSSICDQLGAARLNAENAYTKTQKIASESWVGSGESYPFKSGNINTSLPGSGVIYTLPTAITGGKIRIYNLSTGYGAEFFLDLAGVVEQYDSASSWGVASGSGDYSCFKDAGGIQIQKNTASAGGVAVSWEGW
jgi:hypothetical protein